MPSKMSTFIKISCFCFIYFFRPRLPWIFRIGSTKNVHINLFISVLMNSKLKMETLHTVGRVLCKMHFNWLRLCVKETQSEFNANYLWMHCENALRFFVCGCVLVRVSVCQKPFDQNPPANRNHRVAVSVELPTVSKSIVAAPTREKKQRFSIWLIRETVVVYGFCCCFRCGIHFFLLPENQFSDGNQFRWQPFLIFRWFFRNFGIMPFFRRVEVSTAAFIFKFAENSRA